MKNDLKLMSIIKENKNEDFDLNIFVSQQRLKSHNYLMNKMIRRNFDKNPLKKDLNNKIKLKYLIKNSETLSTLPDLNNLKT